MNIRDIKSTPVNLPNEVLEKLKQLDEAEASSLVTENMQQIEIYDNVKVATCLLTVEDGKLVSKANASDEEKKALAKQRYEEFQNSKDKLGKAIMDNIARSIYLANIESDGKTAIIGPTGNIHVLNMLKSDYKILKHAITMIIFGIALIAIDDTLHVEFTTQWILIHIATRLLLLYYSIKCFLRSIDLYIDYSAGAKKNRRNKKDKQ